MKYQFFIQNINSGTEKQEFRFIMVLDASDSDSMAQTSIQAMITRHQMHTCVNIPFQYKAGHTMKFKLAYVDMDGDPHPVLVIVTSRYGAFRLPFPAGKDGYVLFQKTYRELRNRMIAHRNQSMLKLDERKNKPLAIDGPQVKKESEARPTNSVDPSEHTSKAMNKAPATRAQKQHTNRKPASSTAHSTWWKRQPESLRWLVSGMFWGTLLVSAMFAGKVIADERPGQGKTAPTPQPAEYASEVGLDLGDLDSPYAGFPVPTMADRKAAETLGGCSIGGAATASAEEFGLPGLGTTVTGAK